MTIAEWSGGGRHAADVVRSCIYVTDMEVSDRAARTVARYLRDARPAATLVQVNGLARPEQLIEIELDAIDGAGAAAQRISSGRAIEDEYAYSRAVRVGDRVIVSGTTALSARGVVEGKDDLYRQTRHTMDTIFSALAQAGAAREDIVYTKTFLTDLAHSADYTRAWLEALGEVRPTSTLLGIPALVLPEMLIEIEAEAVIGAAKTRRDIYTQQQREKPRGYARAVEVGDWIWVSGCTSMNAAGRAAGGRRLGRAIRSLGGDRAMGARAGRREPRRRGPPAHVHRRGRPPESAARRGPGLVRQSASSLGCRIAGPARPELLVEVEVTAVKGRARASSGLVRRH
jgi:enamine deaminase RidA (YjgF/YER057c/UK114 family)